MQEWNVSTDIVQIVDENNGTICPVFMFTQEYLSVHLGVLPELWLIVCCHQQWKKKKGYVLHFNNHNAGSKHGF